KHWSTEDPVELQDKFDWDFSALHTLILNVLFLEVNATSRKEAAGEEFMHVHPTSLFATNSKNDRRQNMDHNSASLAGIAFMITQINEIMQSITGKLAHRETRRVSQTEKILASSVLAAH
ncbi:uncharacterized protein Bfra_010240, partial [Botrytis fragariae]